MKDKIDYGKFIGAFQGANVLKAKNFKKHLINLKIIKDSDDPLINTGKNIPSFDFALIKSEVDIDGFLYDVYKHKTENKFFLHDISFEEHH